MAIRAYLATRARIPQGDPTDIDHEAIPPARLDACPQTDVMTRPPQPIRLPTRSLGGITATCVVAFALLTGLVASHWAPLSVGDQIADGAAHIDVLTQPWLLVAARTATAIGSPVVVDVVTVVVGLTLLVTGFWRAAMLVVVARVGELACESVVKVLLARPRPALLDPVAHAFGYSFPSGHAGGSAAVYGALVLLVLAQVPRWARCVVLVVGALVISAVAASRVLLGLHYPSDVTAGVALGLAWVGGAALLVTLPHSTRIRPNRREPHAVLARRRAKTARAPSSGRVMRRPRA
jgi:membrane-associated phospholipid phosphatase